MFCFSLFELGFKGLFRIPEGEGGREGEEEERGEGAGEGGGDTGISGKRTAEAYGEQFWFAAEVPVAVRGEKGEYGGRAGRGPWLGRAKTKARSRDLVSGEGERRGDVGEEAI